MNTTIVWGRVSQYEKDGEIKFLVQYMTADNGCCHTDIISQKLFNHFRALQLNSASLYDGVFEVDSFNRIKLIDIKLD